MQSLITRGVVVSAVVSVSLFSNFAMAEDDPCATNFSGNDVVACNGLVKAQELFAKRNAADLSPTRTAVTTLDAAAAKAEDLDLKYDILVLASRAHYWNGDHVAKDDDKKVEHQKGMDSASAAIAVLDEYADAHYYYAINLGKWALANGILSSLFKKDELIKAAEDAMARDTRDGKRGETIDGYGPHRTLGRLYFKLPGWAGGDNDTALTHLNLAVAGGATWATNTVFLAEVLVDEGGRSNKDRAKAVLDALLKLDPKTLNPSRVPENTEEFATARELRAKL